MKKKRVSMLVMMSVLLAVTISSAQVYKTTLIVSSKDNYWKEVQPTEGTGNANITVRETEKNQVWIGMGGTFNEKGWEALQKLSESDREKALKLLFDKSDGIGFTWGRIPIGASDYALERYTLNETKDDFEMKNFSIQRDKQYLIPYIKAAQKYNPNLHFWASAWTPPTWMKTGAADAAGYDGGEMKNDPKYLAANALYTAKFCEAYKAEGIPISFVFPQNEPGYTQHYPSCGWGEYRKPDNSYVRKGEYLSKYVIDYLEDTLKKRCPETQIWYGTLSNDQTAPKYWTQNIDKLKGIVKGFGAQWNCKPFIKSAISAGLLTMCSEHKCGNYPWVTSVSNVAQADSTHFFPNYAPNNFAYAVESWGQLRDWIKEGVNSYSAWNMVLDTGGFNLDTQRKWPQNALLAVNYNSKTLKITPTYYVFRHIGQYVDSGAVRIGTQGGDALAFLNPDGSVTTIMYNSNSSAAQTTVAVLGKKYTFSLPGQGWATLKVTPPTAAKTISKTKNSKYPILYKKEGGYLLALPSAAGGRVEMLNLSGRIIESRNIPTGCKEFVLSKNNLKEGVILLRVAYGNEMRVLRVFNAN
ncbi:MAG: hypothetical protein N2053_03550 [Chitinispirillaceae bacterium]|nr:hypothetical protein [Chitinispirillaceae bacterium]